MLPMLCQALSVRVAPEVDAANLKVFRNSFLRPGSISDQANPGILEDNPFQQIALQRLVDQMQVPVFASPSVGEPSQNCADLLRVSLQHIYRIQFVIDRIHQTDQAFSRIAPRKIVTFSSCHFVLLPSLSFEIIVMLHPMRKISAVCLAYARKGKIIHPLIKIVQNYTLSH
ncbi:hypothetical protein D3C77_422600 [compost metagenome]